jgi:hypothetical protein
VVLLACGEGCAGLTNSTTSLGVGWVWLVSRIASVPKDEFIEDGNIRKEYNEDDHFVGQRQDRPAPSFRVLRNVYEGYFVAVWPVGGDSSPVWIARAKSDPN